MEKLFKYFSDCCNNKMSLCKAYNAILLFEYHDQLRYAVKYQDTHYYLDIYDNKLKHSIIFGDSEYSYHDDHRIFILRKEIQSSIS